jgi:hypothetical protein
MTKYITKLAALVLVSSIATACVVRTPARTARVVVVHHR